MRTTLKTARLWVSFLAAFCILHSSVALGYETLEETSGVVTREINADGSTQKIALDEMDRPIAVKEADGTITRYWYSEDGDQHVVKTPSSADR